MLLLGGDIDSADTLQPPLFLHLIGDKTMLTLVKIAFEE